MPGRQSWETHDVPDTVVELGDVGGQDRPTPLLGRIIPAKGGKQSEKGSSGRRVVQKRLQETDPGVPKGPVRSLKSHRKRGGQGGGRRMELAVMSQPLPSQERFRHRQPEKEEPAAPAPQTRL